MKTPSSNNNSGTSSKPNAKSNFMNTPKISRSRKPAQILVGSIAVFAALMLAPTGQAVTYTWDVTPGDGATITDGTGTWSVGTPNWNVGGVDQNWADANDAIFGGGASGTAGAVTVGGTVVPTSLTFNQPFAGNYTLNGGTISLGAAATDITDNAVGTTTINSNISLTDNQVWTTGLGATLAVGGNINDGGSIWVNRTLEKQGVGTLRLTGSANVFGALKATAGTLDLHNSNVTLNGNTGETNDAANVSFPGLLTLGAMTTIRGTSAVTSNKGNLTVRSNTVTGAAGHLVMSGSASLNQQGAASEGGSNYYIGFGSYTGIEAGSTMTMKDNSSWTGRVTYWDMHGTFNMQNNASLNLDYPIPNSSGQYVGGFFGRVGRQGNINVTDSASMTAKNINMQGGSIFHQSGNSMVSANNTNSSDSPGGTWTVSGNSTFSMPTTRYTAIGGRFGLRRMQLNIAGTSLAMVDLSNSVEDRSVLFATNAGENSAINLQAGTLLVKTVDAQNSLLVNPSNSAHTSFNFLGGTLKAAQASIRNANLLGNNGLGSAVIYQAGAVVDTNGHDATITQSLLAAAHSGVLTIPVLNGGSGYKYAPTVAWAGGILGWSPTTGKQLGGAQAIVNLTNGTVTSVSIINPGGYVDTSSLSFSLIDHNTGGGGGAVLGTPTFGANATTGGLTKQGAGSLTLSALSTYTGTTAVNSGALLARHAQALGTGNVTVAAGTGLSYLAAADAPLAIGGTLAVTGGAGTVLGTSLGSTGTSTAINVTGAATTSGNVNLQVFGTAFTPTSGLAATTYTLVSAASGLNGATYTPIAMNPTNFTLANLQRTATDLRVDVTSQTALAGNVYWKGTNTAGITKVWAASNGLVGSPDSNWTASNGGTSTPLVPGAGADVVITSSAVTNAPTGTKLGADMTIRTLTISDTANGLSLNADPHFLTITPASSASGITMTAGVPASTIATNIRLGASQTWTNHSANPLTVSGGVLEATALTNLIKEGTGTVILSGATLHTGFTDVRDGTLQLTGTASTPGVLSNLTTLNLGNGANSGRFVLGGANSKYFQQYVFNLTTTGSGTANAVVGGNPIIVGEHIAPVLRVDGGGSTYSGLLGSGILGNTTENNFNFSKVGNGTTTLTNASSTFTGVTSALGGVLSVSSIANAGVASSIGAWSTAGSTVDVTPTRTAGLLLNTGTGGAFRYTGATASSNRGFALQGNSVVDVDSAGTSLTLGDSALGGQGYDFIATGSAGSSLTLGATTIAAEFDSTRAIASHSTLTLASLTEVNDIALTNPSNGVVFRGLGTGTVSGAVSQNQTFSLNVFKDNGGTWNLGGTNTYTGTTTVNGGLLRINGSTNVLSAVTVGAAGGLGGSGTINGTVAVTGGGKLDLANGAINTLTAAGAGTGLALNGGAGTHLIFLDLANAGTTTDKIAVTNNMNMGAGAGVVSLNQLGGAANRLTAGTYDIITAAGGTALTAGGGNFRLETTKAFGQTFLIDAASTTTALKLTTTQVAAGPSAVTLGAASWNVAANFGGTLPEYNSNVTINSALASTLDSSTDINSLTFGASAATVTIAPGTAPAGTPASMLVIEGGTGITSGGTGTHTISAKVGLAASQTWTVNTDLTVSGVVSDFGGEYSLTKAGTGVLTLSGANTYAGNTTVSAGTLKLGHATALGRTTGAVSVTGTGAVLDLNGQTVNNASVTINGTGISSGGALINNTGTGTVNSTVVMASDSSIGVGTGATLTLAATSTSVAGMLRGNFNLTKVGAGTLNLNAANSFGSSSKTFTIAAGTVVLGNSIGLGNAANNIVVTAGAMLNLNNQTVLNTNPLTINGTGVSLGGALQNGTYAGPITLGNHSSIVGNNNTILLNSGGITGGFNLELGGTSLLNRIDSAITTGAGTLTKVGAGTWTLRGANTYTGGTTLTTGMLQFMKAASMPAAGTVAVGTGTTLAVNVGAGGEWTTGTTGAGTLGGLLAGVGGQAGAAVTYTGTVTLGIDTTNASIVNVISGNQGISGTGTVTSRFHDTAVQTYSGVIANPAGVTLGLNKLGLNTLALTGANSYTGVTTVTGGGVLQASNLQNAGVNSSIGAFAAAGAAGLVLNGGTLQYTGGTTTTDRGFTLLADNSIIDVNTPGTALTMGASSLGAFRFAATGSAGSSLNLGAATLTGNATLVGGIPLTITSLTGAGQNVTLSGDVTVTAATFSGNATITASNGRVTLNTLANSATNTITLRGAGTSSASANNNGNNLSLGTVSGVIANGNAGAAIMSITKDDAGIWAFSNANTYTGVTTITNGVLRLDHATALPGGIGATGGTSALTFNGNNAVLGLGAGDFTRGLGSGVDQVQFSNNGGWAAYGADRAVNLGGASAPVVWATATTGFNAKQLNLGAASATHTVDLQNPIDFGTAARTVQVEDGPAALEAKMSGILSGGAGGTLTKMGSGKLLLSGVNTYVGLTTVTLGTLVVTDPSALGTTAGATTVGFFAASGTTTGNLGATLDVQANIGLEPLNVGGFGVGGIGALRTSTGTGTVGGLVTLFSKTTLGSEGTLNIDGTLTANGHAVTTVGSGVITFGAAGSLASLYSLTVTDGTTNVNSALGAAAGNADVVVGDGFGGTAKLRFGSVSQTLGSLTIGAGATVVFTSGAASGAFSSGDKGAGFGGGATVPEPGTLGLLLVGALGMLNRRRRA